MSSNANAQERIDSVYQLQDIIISASKIEARDLSIPALISVKKLSEIQIPGAKNYFDLLSKVAGIKINSRQDNATQNDIDIRGLSGNATSGTNLLIILDEIPQRRLSYGGPYLGALPFEAITRMELMKGPASSLYGRFALAGVLQLFTNPVSDRLSAKIRTSYDDLTGSVQAALQISGSIIPKLTASLTVNSMTSHGWQPYGDTKRKELYLNLGYALGEQSKLKLLLGHIAAFENTVAPVFIDSVGNLKEGFFRNTNIAVPNQNNLDLKENRIAGIWNQQISDQMSFNVKSSYWTAKTFINVGRPDDQPASGTKVARSSSIRDWDEYVFFNEAEALYKSSLTNYIRLNTMIGGSYEKLNWYQKQTNIGISGTSQNIPLDLVTLVEPTPQTWIYTIMPEKVTNETDYGMFIKAQLSFMDFVDVHLGVRYDGFTREQYDPNIPNVVMKLTDHALSPNVGCIVEAFRSEEHRTSIYGSYGKGFSPIYRAVGSTYFASVIPEISENYEFGTKSYFWHNFVSFNGAYFSISRSNIVLTNPATNMPENGGQWDVHGVEVGLNINLLPYFSFYNNVAISTSEISKDINNPKNVGKKIPLNAETIVSAGFEIHNIFIMTSNQTSLELGGSLDYQYVSKRYGNEANSFLLPGYHLFNATATIQWNTDIQFGIFVKNIFDEFYYTTVFSSVKKGSAFVGMPRSFGISCQIAVIAPR